MSGPEPKQASAHQLVDHLFRSRAGQMVAWLTHVFGPEHLELAEEVVQDALVKALQQWPYSGVPENPSAWLLRVAKNGALDVLRRRAAFRGRAPQIIAELTRRFDTSEPARWAVEDDELRMVFMWCHPSLPPDGRVALSLKTVGGFSVPEIARAFLVNDATISQRIVRAKRTLRVRQVGLELPHGWDLHERLESVLEVIYLMFNEGYNAHSGDDLIRLDLCGEALRLARLVADSPVTSPAAHALVALVAFQAARLPARVDGAGELLLLEEHDRSLCDRRLVALGFEELDRSSQGPEMTTCHVQAAIAAVHASAATADDTRWPEILTLYDDLLALNPSPVVALNRAVALSRVAGVRAALDVIAQLEDDRALANYYLLPSVKGLAAQQPRRSVCSRRMLSRRPRSFLHGARASLPCSAAAGM